MKKRLVAVYTMPPRATSAERIATVDADVREAAASLRATLTQKAQPMTVIGYVMDEDSWEFALNQRNIVGTVIVERPD